MFHPDGNIKPQSSRQLDKQKTSKSSLKEIGKNQPKYYSFSKEEPNSEQKQHEANKDEEAGSSESKAKKDENKEKHLEG